MHARHSWQPIWHDWLTSKPLAVALALALAVALFDFWRYRLLDVLY